MSRKHQVVTLYRRYPLLFFAVLFFCGQLLQSYYVHSIWILGALGLISIAFSRLTVMFFNIILLGSLSYLLAADFSKDIKVDPEMSYVVRVNETPRRKRVGEIQVIFELLEMKVEHLEALFVDTGYKIICRGKDLDWENESQLEMGDIVVIKADYRPIVFDWNPFAYKQTLLNRGIKQECKLRYVSRPISSSRSLIRQYKSDVTERVRSILGNQERAGLFLSMTLGERDSLSDYTEQTFKASGLAHLLVVSGYQISIIFFSARELFKLLLLRLGAFSLGVGVGRLAALGGFMASLVFSLLVGFEASVLRAFSAALLFVFAGYLERHSSLINSLLFSFFVLHIFSPLCIFEPGVQLTFAALIGLGLGARNRAGISAALVSSIYASIATAIVSYIWFSQFSIIGLILNPLFAGMVSFFSCNLGFLAILLLMLGVDSGGIFLQFVADGLEYFKEFVEWCVSRSS